MYVQTLRRQMGSSRPIRMKLQKTKRASTRSLNRLNKLRTNGTGEQFIVELRTIDLNCYEPRPCPYINTYYTYIRSECTKIVEIH